MQKQLVLLDVLGLAFRMGSREEIYCLTTYFQSIANGTCLLRHSPHLGPMGRQICWPKPTSNMFTSLHLKKANMMIFKGRSQTHFEIQRFQL